MTKRTTIGQPEIERALKACKRAGYEKARVHINIAAGTIDIMLGEDQPPAAPAYNPWDEEFRETGGDAMLARVKKRLAEIEKPHPRNRRK